MILRTASSRFAFGAKLSHRAYTIQCTQFTIRHSDHAHFLAPNRPSISRCREFKRNRVYHSRAFGAKKCGCLEFPSERVVGGAFLAPNLNCACACAACQMLCKCYAMLITLTPVWRQKGLCVDIYFTHSVPVCQQCAIISSGFGAKTRARTGNG